MPDTTTPTTSRADYEYMVAMLSALPAYSLVTVYCSGTRVQELMARDIPYVGSRAHLLGSDPGRRFTNLTSGMEWFITAEGFENLDVTAVTVHPFTIERRY